MQIATIASKIIKVDKVPIHFEDTKTFSSVTYLKPDSNLERGLHLPNCDSAEALDHCKASMPDGFERTKKYICTKCAFDEISFVIFSILHELGHWIQYTEFVNKGHSDQEFIFAYELDRALLFSQREVEYKTCRCKEDVIELNKKYDILYSELPTEKYANDFALSHLSECVMMVK